MSTIPVGDSAEDGPIYHIPVGPPPPRAVQVIALVLAVIATILGFLGRGPLAGIAALGSFIFGAYDLATTVNTVNVSTNVVDREGKLNMKQLERK